MLNINDARIGEYDDCLELDSCMLIGHIYGFTHIQCETLKGTEHRYSASKSFNTYHVTIKPSGEYVYSKNDLFTCKCLPMHCEIIKYYNL